MACYYKHVFGVSLVLLFLAFGGSLVCLLTTNWVEKEALLPFYHKIYFGLIAAKSKVVGDWEPRSYIFEFKEIKDCEYTFFEKNAHSIYQIVVEGVTSRGFIFLIMQGSLLDLEDKIPRSLWLIQ